MSNYVKSTDFAAKDALTTGNPLKLIKGTEINDEFNNLQTAIATKADLSSPALSGNPTAPTQAIGNNSTRLANTAFVQQEISDAEAAIAITGGNISGVNITDVIITDADISGLVAPLAVADGGTGVATLTANAVLLGNGTTALQTVAPTTAGNVLTADGTTWGSSPRLILDTPQASTSGAAITFSSIPSWVRKIHILISGVSISGTAVPLVQVGTSSGFDTTGYAGSGGYANNASPSVITSSTSGFVLSSSTGASSLLHGEATLTLLNSSSNLWVFAANLGRSGESIFSVGAGSKALSAVLDRVRVTTDNGAISFDAGSINIMYE